MTIIIFLFLISTLALLHELGHFLMAKLSKVKVEEFGLGFPPRVLSFKKGETTYSINLLPLGGFVRLLGEDTIEETCDDPRAFCNRPHYQQGAILLSGVVMNLILGLVLLSLVFTRFGVPRVLTSLMIEEIVPDSPASVSELEVGDEIVGYAVAGGEFNKIDLSENFLEFIKSNLGKEISLLVRASGVEEFEEVNVVKVRLRSEFVESEGALGIQFTAYPYIFYERIPLSGVISESFRQTADMLGMIFKNIGLMLARFFRIQRVPEGFAGPVGIARIVGEVAKQGWGPLVHFAGVLSISLAGFNILPLPALDGGRLVLVVLEVISGRKIKAGFQRLVNLFGLIFLLLLLTWVTFWDIVKFF